MLPARVWYQIKGDGFASKQDYALPWPGNETATAAQGHKEMKLETMHMGLGMQLGDRAVAQEVLDLVLSLASHKSNVAAYKKGRW